MRSRLPPALGAFGAGPLGPRSLLAGIPGSRRSLRIVAQIRHSLARPSYPRSILHAEIPDHRQPEQTSEALIAELRAAKLEYLHAAVDALAAVELWLALDAWIPGDEATAETDAA